MLENKYKIFATSNNYKGVPDPARFERLAQKMITTSGFHPDPATVKKFTLELIRKYTSGYSGGVCSGMVCDWAFNYLDTGNPETPPNVDKARLSHGQYSVTIAKRAALAKIEAVSVATQKMYLNRGLYLTTMIKGGAFPATTNDFKLITEKIINWADLTSEVPFSFDIGDVQSGGSHGGHAIGLLNHAGYFYILDPTFGLYRFPNRDTAQREINNHFVGIVVPNSSLDLTAIGTLIN